MSDIYAKVLETKEIFTLNLDDYSGIDDFEESKSLLWNFRYYLKNNINDVHVFLKIEKDDINDLSNNLIKDQKLYEILNSIILKLK